MGDTSWPRANDTVALAAVDLRRVVALRLSPDADVAGFDQPETFSVVEDVHAAEVTLTGVRVGPPPPRPRRDPQWVAIVAPKGDAVATTALLTDALHAFGTDDWDRCTPCSTGTDQGRRILAETEQLVLNVLATIDAIYAASLALDWIQRCGFGTLVENALVIIHQVKDEAPLAGFTRHFQRRCRSVVLVPTDPLIEAGVAAAFDELRPDTQAAYWEVIEQLARRASHHDAQRSTGLRGGEPSPS